MTSPNDRASAIFLAMAGVDPAERAAWLDRECGPDPALRADVESLLAGLDGDAGVLDTPVVAPGRMRDVVTASSLPTPQAATDASLALDHDDDTRIAMGTQVGDFTLLDVLGTGGAGVVYRALQRRPMRTVALKVLREGLASAGVRRRFEVEAEILGRLQHPGIAQVYAAHAGDATTPSFIAMELVDGPALTDFVAEGRLDVPARLQLFARVCDAVQHAHQRGVIHRDLKPANILVAPDGQPKVLDFGVARAVGADFAHSTIHTEHGQLLGTLAFMSPEQIHASPDAIDTRSDVYSLGVVLFRLLSDRVPFADADPSLPELARRITSDPPPRLSSLVPALAGDLDTIVARTLAKEKDRRYASAADLAADIRRYVAGQPIAASDDSAWYLLRTRVGRYRRALVASGLGLVVLAGVAGYASWQRARAQHLSTTLERELSSSNIERGRLLGLTGNHRAAGTIVWRELFTHPESTHARWTLAELASRQPALWSRVTNSDGVVGVRFDRDGRRLLTAGVHGSLLISDATSGAPLLRFVGHRQRAMRAVFVDGDAQVASTSDDRTLRIWDARTGVATHVLEHDANLGALEAFPDVARVAYAVGDVIRIIDTRQGVEVDAFTPHTSPIRNLDVDGAGRRIATMHDDGFVVLWDVAGRRVSTAWRAHDVVVASGTFSPDGRSIVTTDVAGNIRLWDVASRRLLHAFTIDNGTARSAAFSADGRQLAVAGWWRASVWSLADGTRRDYAASIGAMDVDFDPTGTRLATTDELPGRVYLWDLRADPRVATWRAFPDRVSSLVLVDEGREVISSGYDGTLARMAIDGSSPRAWQRTGVRLRSVTLDPSGEVAAVAGIRDHVAIVSSADGTERARVPARSGSAIADFADGHTVIVGASDGELTLTRWRDGTVQQRWPGNDGEVLAMLVADGRVVVAHRRWAVVVRDARDGREVARLRTGTAPFALARSRDGRWIAIGQWSGTIDIWDTQTWTVSASLRGHARVVSGLDFSPDGRLLASASREGHAGLWEVGTWANLASTVTRPAGAERVRFLPDSRRLVIGYDDGQIDVVDLEYFHRHVAGNAESQYELLTTRDGLSLPRAADVLSWSRTVLSR